MSNDNADNAGIDWGFGQSNRTQVNGVTYHYGVIPVADVLQAWSDSSTAIYPDDDDAGAEHDFVCERAQEVFDSCAEVLEFVLDDSEYAASQAADDSDIFITQSDFYTWCAYCSPCAPGAGYLTDSRAFAEGIRAFCFSHDWFDSGCAPYAVWRVDNGALVIPDNPHAGMLQYAARADFAQRVAAWKEFNAAIVEYAEEWADNQFYVNAVARYIAAIESAFAAGGYTAIVALGDFAQWADSLA